MTLKTNTIENHKTKGQLSDAIVHRELQNQKQPIFLRFLHISLWTIASIILVVLLLELSFDLANVGEEDFLKVDPIFGFTHLNDKFVTFRTEGYSQSQINNNEFRDNLYTLAKAKNTYRIVVLGDSKVAGFEVPRENTFSKILERSLNEKYSQKHFEVMNCGMSGYSTGQEYLLFTQKLLKYKPDMAILAYNFADSDENIPAMKALPRPYFSLDKNNALTIDWHFVDELLNSRQAKYYANFDWLHRNSHILGMWYKTALNVSNNKTYKIIVSLFDKPFNYLQSKVFSHYANPNFDLSFRSEIQSLQIPVANIAQKEENKIPTITNLSEGNLWANEFYSYCQARKYQEKVTAEILKQFNAQCSAHHCPLVVLGLPAPNNSIFYFHELKGISKLAQDYNFKFIDLNKYFPSLAPMEKSPYYILVHFSSAGHALVAKTIMNQLFSQTQFK
jgi:lysophospholipase L1-like esterase